MLRNRSLRLVSVLKTFRTRAKKDAFFGTRLAMVLEFLKSLDRPVEPRMFFEKRVSSFGALMREASALDSDAGIRLKGRYGGHACYCFVTRFGNVFTAMIYARKAGRVSPGRLLASVQLENVEQLERLLREVTSSGVDVYVY